MKATLHFEHDEQDELQDALNGLKWRLIVWDLDQYLRGIVKHGYIGNREATDAEIEMAEYCRTKLRQLINDDGLNLEG
jgi:hypothetical protein